jgi:hypothetical protein
VIKMLFLCRRRPDLTREEYARRILEGHAPLALVHHPHMRRYVIQIADGVPPDGDEIDSLPALWFDSIDDFRNRLYDSPEGEAIIHEDVERFMGGSDAYATREQVHRDEDPKPATGQRSPGMKTMQLLMRRPELSRAEFRDRWTEEHVPLVLAHQPGLSLFSTSWVEEKLSDTGENWDAFAETRFASDEACAFDSPEGERTVAESLARLTVRAPVYRVHEYVWK